MIEQIPPSIQRMATAAKQALGSPLWPLAAAAFSLLGFGLWLWEHDAHVRQAYQLSQLKAQTAADVSALQAQAQAAIREANEQHAQAIRELESRERKFGQEAGQLRERIAALQNAEHARLEQVATLPASELVSRVATQLGLSQARQDSGARRESEVRSQKSEETTNNSRTQSLNGSIRSNPQSRDSAVGTPPLQTALALDEGALRRVDSALVELDSCKEQGAVLNTQIANLNNQVGTDATMISQQAASIGKLNQAIQAKDQILARKEAEHRAELKAARGTLASRAAHLIEHVAAGIVIGVLIR